MVSALDHGPARVLLLGPGLNAVSGVTTHLRMLLRSPLAQVYALIHVQVGSEGREAQEGRWGRWLRLAWSPLGLALALHRQRADLVHLNTSMNPKAFWRDLVYATVVRAMGRPMLVQIHGGELPAPFLGARPWARRWLAWALQRDAQVVVLSREEELAWSAWLGAQRVLRVPNAIDLADFPVPAAVPVPGQAPCLELVYVGRLVRAKGIFETLSALAQLWQEGRGLRLTIAGYGADEAALRDEVQRLGLTDMVRFAGPVFGAEKVDLWLASDVFVFPTEAEGLPYALLEAMAAGCVPLSTRVGAIPDVVEDGTHGLLVSPQDVPALTQALRVLDDDRARLARMALASLGRVHQDYSLRRLARDMASAYRHLLQRVPDGATGS